MADSLLFQVAAELYGRAQAVSLDELLTGRDGSGPGNFVRAGDVPQDR